MVRIDRICPGLIKLLNQREDKAGVPVEFLHQIVSAGGYELAGLSFSQEPAIFKGIANLFVQFVPICQNYNRGRTCKLSTDFLGQKYHGITFATALRVPENTQLTFLQLAGLIGFDCLIDPQVLVVTGENFSDPSSRMIK